MHIFIKDDEPMMEDVWTPPATESYPPPTIKDVANILSSPTSPITPPQTGKIPPIPIIPLYTSVQEGPSTSASSIPPLPVLSTCLVEGILSTLAPPASTIPGDIYNLTPLGGPTNLPPLAASPLGGATNCAQLGPTSLTTMPSSAPEGVQEQAPIGTPTAPPELPIYVGPGENIPEEDKRIIMRGKFTLKWVA